MINSNNNNSIRNSINDIYKLNSKELYLNNCYRNNNKIPKSQISSKYYLTINLDKSTKENDPVLMSSIYQTIKKENKKSYTSNHSTINSRNNFITKVNELINNNNKTSYMTPTTEIKNKTIYQDNEHLKKNNENKK